MILTRRQRVRNSQNSARGSGLLIRDKNHRENALRDTTMVCERASEAEVSSGM